MQGLLYFTAFMLWIISSLLMILRGWKVYNYEQTMFNKPNIELFKFFINHIDSSIMMIEPLRKSNGGETLENLRKNTNRITYSIYLLWLFAIVILIIAFSIKS